MNTLNIDDVSTVERFEVITKTTADPTAAAPAWQLTALGAKPSSGAWTNGSWLGSYDAAGQKATGLSPLVGSTGFTITAGRSYLVWVRWTAVDETPVRAVGIIRT